MLHIWNQWLLCSPDYLSFGINCTLICVSVIFLLSYRFRVDVMHATIWIYISPYFACNVSCICVRARSNECIHGSIDLEKRVWDFNIGQVPLTSHVLMPACWPLSSRASNFTFLRFDQKILRSRYCEIQEWKCFKSFDRESSCVSLSFFRIIDHLVLCESC